MFDPSDFHSGNVRSSNSFTIATTDKKIPVLYEKRGHQFQSSQCLHRHIFATTLGRGI